MFPYQDPKKNIEERVEDLLQRMTLEEKIMQTDQHAAYYFAENDTDGFVKELHLEKLDELFHGHSVGSIQLRGCTAAQANEIQRYAVEKTRLGIPFLFSEEALHGFMSKDATCFPQQIGLAATFHPELGYQMGRCIATEAYVCGVRETFSPVMDLIRDPRYGRGEESYGEDIHLCAEFARETVRGLQGDSLKDPDTVAAEPKHYVGYGNPVAGLNCAPSTMGRHEVFAQCMPVFEEAFVEGGAVNAMCSYNAIDGIPVSMDHEILTDVLRGQFGMPGFVRSDMTAVVRLNDWHFVAPTRKEAIRLGVEAGVDLQLFDYPHDEWCNGLAELIRDGEMKEEVLDEACRRILRVKFMLGLFENPYVEEGREKRTLRCQAHKDVALQIARESICLLKNDRDLLPLSKNLKTVAVLGPAADEPALGDYTAHPDRSHSITVLDGIRAAVSPETEVLYEHGCNFLGDTIHPFDQGYLVAEDGKMGLTGRYYNNRTFSGEPVAVRNDLMINFNWIYTSPHAAVDSSCFSVVWTGAVRMPYELDGCIGLSSQDSMRLYIDGKLLIDGWGEGKNSSQLLPFHFEKGKTYDVRIEYTNDMRGARVIFGYNSGMEDYSKALEAARRADVAIVCLGDNEETSGENFDRVSLDLPGSQLDFLKAVYETGTPVVLVIQGGRPVTANWEQAHIPAILEAWFPGEQGGTAVAETLFGDNNPAGRLPITFPRSVGQIPCHYSRLPGGGWRYVEMDWMPLYPFGYGLSYTRFRYDNLSLSAETIRPGEPLEVSFDVTNIGDREGTDVPQVYIRDCFSSTVKPVRELAAFTRVTLQPGETRRVTVTVSPRRMRTLGPDYVWRVEPGEFRIMVGSNAADTQLEGGFTAAE